MDWITGIDISLIKTNTFSFSLTDDFKKKSNIENFLFAKNLKEFHKILVETNTKNDRI
jgi:hypothetical protein